MWQISLNLLKYCRKSVRHFSTTNRIMCSYEEKQIRLVDDKKNTYNVNFVQLGHGCNNAIILMPGALGSAFTDFQPQIEKLPKLLPNYSIIAWDPPGYGKSVPPQRTFPIDFFHRDAFVANELMVSLGFKRYSVVGWSDGGITGILLAAKFTDAVEKLIIWGANSYILPEETKIYESIKDVSKWSAKMRAPMEKLYGDHFPQLWSAWIDAMLEIYKQNNGDICKNELSAIRAKTLIVHGCKDPMVAAEHIPYLRKHIKNSEYYEFADGKHNIHLRYADEFNEILKNFLQAH